MRDFFADRIPLNEAPAVTHDGTHGVTGQVARDHAGSDDHDNSGMWFEVLKAPDDTKKIYVNEFPSQSADVDMSQKGVIVNPQATN